MGSAVSRCEEQIDQESQEQETVPSKVSEELPVEEPGPVGGNDGLLESYKQGVPDCDALVALVDPKGDVKVICLEALEAEVGPKVVEVIELVPLEGAADEGGESDSGETEDTEGGGGEEEEEEAPKPEIVIETAPYDLRFPATNQARYCYTRYNEFHKCVAEKGDADSPDCLKYAKAYRSLCPSEWVEKWNEQREEGTWAGKY